MSKPRIKVPKKVTAGEAFTIKTLVSHKMESGQRKDKEGNPIPRKIINKFSCEFNGATVFACDIEPGVAANPYFEFKAKVAEAGTLKFTWVDDDGKVIEAEKDVALS